MVCKSRGVLKFAFTGDKVMPFKDHKEVLDAEKGVFVEGRGQSKSVYSIVG